LQFEDIHIDFTTGELNDALKSLTAVDLSGGKSVGSVTALWLRSNTA